MINNELLEKIQKVRTLNNDENITTIAIEELGELIQILCKLKRWVHYDNTLRREEKQIFADLKEEIADVYLLLEQIKIITNIEDYEIERIINEKIERTFRKVGVLNY